mmetsp:Transcript_35562/g.111256  ORF Transcript_35562/g.111256 Transcript_35562/m.111256 type:complete len:812 (-) Transcript_35562:267-2702(-)
MSQCCLFLPGHCPNEGAEELREGRVACSRWITGNSREEQVQEPNCICAPLDNGENAMGRKLRTGPQDGFKEVVVLRGRGHIAGDGGELPGSTYPRIEHDDSNLIHILPSIVLFGRALAVNGSGYHSEVEDCSRHLDHDCQRELHDRDVNNRWVQVLVAWLRECANMLERVEDGGSTAHSHQRSCRIERNDVLPPEVDAALRPLLICSVIVLLPSTRACAFLVRTNRLTIWVVECCAQEVARGEGKTQVFFDLEGDVCVRRCLDGREFETFDSHTMQLKLAADHRSEILMLGMSGFDALGSKKDMPVDGEGVEPDITSKFHSQDNEMSIPRVMGGQGMPTDVSAQLYRTFRPGMKLILRGRDHPRSSEMKERAQGDPIGCMIVGAGMRDGPKDASSQGEFYLDCQFLAVRADRLWALVVSFRVSGFSGFVEHDFPLVPLTDEATERRMADRFEALQAYHQGCHAFEYPRSAFLPWGSEAPSSSPHGRIVLDSQESLKYLEGATSSKHAGQQTREESEGSLGYYFENLLFQLLHHFCINDDRVAVAKVRVLPSSWPRSPMEKRAMHELRSCAIPVVAGYSLSQRRWGHVLIDRVSPVLYNNHAFHDVLMSQKKKIMLLAAVEGHALQVGGGATVVMLHGSHGVGKRFIVGAIGDELKLPVLRISISQLCLELETFRESLLSALSLATRWRAMVFCEHVECLSSMSGSLDYIFAEIIRSYDGLVFMTTTQMSQLSSCLHECSTLTLEITELEGDELSAMWARELCDTLEQMKAIGIMLEDGIDLVQLSGEPMKPRQVSLPWPRDRTQQTRAHES